MITYENNIIKYSNKEYGSGELYFHDAKAYIPWRARTLFTKEPWTLKWFMQLEEDDVLWDIGANVGLYSLWAAHKTPCKNIYSFEPSSYNYPILHTNIIKNNYQDRITAYPIGLSDFNIASEIGLEHPNPGAASASLLSKFKNQHIQKQGCIALSGDFLIDLGIPSPTHLKIDVDGIEPYIINGLENAIAETVKSIIVEIDQTNPLHMAAFQKLKDIGYGFEIEHLKEVYRNRKDTKFCAMAEFILTKV